MSRSVGHQVGAHQVLHSGALRTTSADQDKCRILCSLGQGGFAAFVACNVLETSTDCVMCTVCMHKLQGVHRGCACRCVPHRRTPCFEVMSYSLYAGSRFGVKAAGRLSGELSVEGRGNHVGARASRLDLPSNGSTSASQCAHAHSYTFKQLVLETCNGGPPGAHRTARQTRQRCGAAGCSGSATHRRTPITGLHKGAT